MSFTLLIKFFIMGIGSATVVYNDMGAAYDNWLSNNHVGTITDASGTVWYDVSGANVTFNYEVPRRGGPTPDTTFTYMLTQASDDTKCPGVLHEPPFEIVGCTELDANAQSSLVNNPQRVFVAGSSVVHSFINSGCEPPFATSIFPLGLSCIPANVFGPWLTSTQQQT